MKFRIFRSAEDQTGAGPVDPTQTPRMGGQVLPEVAPASNAAPAEPRVEDATPVRSATVVDTPPTGPIKIAARDVSVFYEGKQALYDVSLDIPDKTVTALIGPSGCGKSTFLRTMNRMNDTIAGAKVTDQRTGLPAGKALFIPWRGKLLVIGLENARVSPAFLPQPHLTYWCQDLGFSSHPEPDFPHEPPAHSHPLPPPSP
jgi:hypothetical protein